MPTTEPEPAAALSHLPLESHEPRWLTTVGVIVGLTTLASAGMWGLMLQGTAGQDAQWFAIAFSPLTVLGVGVMGWFCISLIGAGVTSYRITAEAFERRSAFGHRRVRWADVRDFNLAGGLFPTVPSSLYLIDHSGRRCEVPTDPVCSGNWMEAIFALIPGLAEHGLTSCRESIETVPRVPTLQWHGLVAKSFVVVIAGSILITTLVASRDNFRDYLNYHRITADPVERIAVIDEVHVREDDDDIDVDITVTYTDAQGNQHTTRRRVFPGLRHEFKSGDELRIQHLLGSPHIMRIPEWDPDEGRLIILFAIAFFLWLLAAVTVGTAASVILPRNERHNWMPLLYDDDPRSAHHTKFLMSMPTERMEDLAAIFPEQHLGGALAIQSIQFAGEKSDEPNAADLQHKLASANISCETIADTYLVLPAEEAVKWWSRLRRAPKITATYGVMKSDDTAAARQWLLDHFDEDPDNDGESRPFEATRFACISGAIGLIDRSDLHSAKRRWLSYHTERFFNDRVPVGMISDELDAIADTIDPENYSPIRLEKWGQSFRLRVGHIERERSRVYEFDRGRWHDVGEQDAHAFRSGSCATSALVWTGVLSLSPFILLLLPAALAVLPFNAWDRARRRRKLAAARDELDSPRAEADDVPDRADP